MGRRAQTAVVAPRELFPAAPALRAVATVPPVAELLAVEYANGYRCVFRLASTHARRSRADAEVHGERVALRDPAGRWSGWLGPLPLSAKQLAAVPLAAPSVPARLAPPVQLYVDGPDWTALRGDDKAALKRLARFRRAPGGMATDPIESPVTLEALQLAARELGLALEVTEVPPEPTATHP